MLESKLYFVGRGESFCFFVFQKNDGSVSLSFSIPSVISIGELHLAKLVIKLKLY